MTTEQENIYSTAEGKTSVRCHRDTPTSTAEDRVRIFGYDGDGPNDNVYVEYTSHDNVLGKNTVTSKIGRNFTRAEFIEAIKLFLRNVPL